MINFAGVVPPSAWKMTVLDDSSTFGTANVGSAAVSRLQWAVEE